MGAITIPGAILNEFTITKISFVMSKQQLIDVLKSNVFEINDVEESSATVTYVGLERADGFWYLKKVDTTSGTAIGHATIMNNTTIADYSTAWTNRATLTYNDYSGAF